MTSHFSTADLIVATAVALCSLLMMGAVPVLRSHAEATTMLQQPR